MAFALAASVRYEDPPHFVFAEMRLKHLSTGSIHGPANGGPGFCSRMLRATARQENTEMPRHEIFKKDKPQSCCAFGAVILSCVPVRGCSEGTLGRVWVTRTEPEAAAAVTHARFLVEQLTLGDG